MQLPILASTLPVATHHFVQWRVQYMRVRHSTLAASALAIGVSLPAETVCDTGVSMADIPLTTGRLDRGPGALSRSLGRPGNG